MALDGIVMADLVCEMRERLIGGKISRIIQPESDELLLTIRNQNRQDRLLISANAGLPLMYFTERNLPAPAAAPNFCMVLRKHIANGRILSVTQPGLDRVVRIGIEHRDEMGDLCQNFLIVELMGKYSNIIFADSDDRILDAIRHVPGNVSSVREVLPGRPYFLVDTVHKKDPLTLTEEEFRQEICGRPVSVAKALNGGLTGIGPLMSEEAAARAGLDSGRPIRSLTPREQEHLYYTLMRMMDEVRAEHFSPRIVYRKEEPIEFAALPLSLYEETSQRKFSSVSELLETYYAQKNAAARIRQRSADLRRIVQTTLERDMKKYDLQKKQLKDTQKREKYRIWGELIETYGTRAEPGASSLTAENYYDEGREITIPLDPTQTPQENAVRYFQKYNKLKRTHQALTGLLEETSAEIEHLRSIQVSLSLAQGEEDLAQIRREMQDAGYIRKHPVRDNHKNKNKKKEKPTSRPLHYLSSDGFHIYIGKNNLQNEDLTFRFAEGNDLWFHAKGIPGSHVIVKADGRDLFSLPDRLFEEAAALAGYYSSERTAEKVEVDYIQKKFIKKPAGARPGFVIYHSNYSIVGRPAQAKELTQIEETQKV